MPRGLPNGHVGTFLRSRARHASGAGPALPRLGAGGNLDARPNAAHSAAGIFFDPDAMRAHSRDVGGAQVFYLRVDHVFFLTASLNALDPSEHAGRIPALLPVDRMKNHRISLMRPCPDFR